MEGEGVFEKGEGEAGDGDVGEGNVGGGESCEERSKGRVAAACEAVLAVSGVGSVALPYLHGWGWDCTDFQGAQVPEGFQHGAEDRETFSVAAEELMRHALFVDERFGVRG